jgi:hypothetical protein
VQGAANASLTEIVTLLRKDITIPCSCFSYEVPSSSGYKRPDGFDQPKRPSTLKKPVNRTQRTGSSKGQDVPGVAFFQHVTNKHRRHSEKAKSGKTIHEFLITPKVVLKNRITPQSRTVTELFDLGTLSITD